MRRFETLDEAVETLISDIETGSISQQTEENLIHLLRQIQSAPDELQDANYSMIFEHFYNVIE